MSTEKEQNEIHEPTSAPPVLGISHKTPLISRSVAKVETKPEQTAQVSDDDLPADMTDNIETDRAVDAISSEEADEILATEDFERQAAESSMPKHRIRAFFSAWFGTKRGWKWTLGILFLIVVGLASVPTSRYWILNSAGVRCSLSLSTLDGGTQLALPGATVSVGSVQGVTDHTGFVALHELKLGPQTLTISRPGFAKVYQHLVLGWGSNPLGAVTLKNTGVQYTLYVHDYLTGASIVGASANNNGSQTLADKTGKITMTISGNENEQPIPVTVSAAGYAPQNVTLNAMSNKPITVSLAPSQKEVYVANQDGVYNLSSSYIDGTDKQVLLAGTSTETSAISLAVSPDGSEAALVSTRDPNYDSNGSLLQAVTLVNVADGTVQTLDHAEQAKLIGWVGSTLIYEEETASGSSPSFNIVSYNYATSTRDQLATSGQFTGVLLAGGIVYYAIPASASTTGNGFFSVRPDSSGKQTILSQDVWSVIRGSYTNINIDTANGWYSYTLGGNTASTIASAPSNLTNTQYLDSPDGKVSASVVNGQLNVYTMSSGKTQTLGTISNAAYPLRWLTNTELIYRVTDGSTSADYVVSVASGISKLVTSVMNTTGISGS